MMYSGLSRSLLLTPMKMVSVKSHTVQYPQRNNERTRTFCVCVISSRLVGALSPVNHNGLPHEGEPTGTCNQYSVLIPSRTEEEKESL